MGRGVDLLLVGPRNRDRAFFFSSRRRHTSCSRDWSSDVCSSDLFPFYNLYETKDHRWISVACVETKFWRRLCEILRIPEHVEDQFVAGEMARPIAAKMVAAFRGKTLADWTAVFDREDLPVAPVLNVDEVVADPHLNARRLLPEVSVGRTRHRVLAHPVVATKSRARTLGRAPEQGEHT